MRAVSSPSLYRKPSNFFDGVRRVRAGKIAKLGNNLRTTARISAVTLLEWASRHCWVFLVVGSLVAFNGLLEIHTGLRTGSLRGLPFANVRAAVHVQHLPCDVTGLRQINDSLSDVLCVRAGTHR